MADKTKVITLEELKLHKDEKSLWIAIYDNVYDITKFAAEFLVVLAFSSWPRNPGSVSVPIFRIIIN